MTRFEVANNSKGQLYLRQELQEVLHGDPLVAIANAEAVIIFPNDAPLEAVKKSLDILMRDLDLRIEKEQRQNGRLDDKDKENSHGGGGWRPKSPKKID